MADEKNLDGTFPEVQDTEVYSATNHFRYQKKFKQGNEAKGRKQSRFHKKTKDLSAGIRAD